MPGFFIADSYGYWAHLVIASPHRAGTDAVTLMLPLTLFTLASTNIRGKTVGISFIFVTLISYWFN
jgi:hypothetical protein